MFSKLDSTEKKMVTGLFIAGAVFGIGYLIKQSIDAGNIPDTPQEPQGPQQPQLPGPQQPPVIPRVILPQKLQYNENVNLCYKGPYIKMNKTLQSIINEIASRNKHKLITVDGIFGIDTLKRVRAYFGGNECVTLKKAFQVNKDSKAYIGPQSW